MSHTAAGASFLECGAYSGRDSNQKGADSASNNYLCVSEEWCGLVRGVPPHSGHEKKEVDACRSRANNIMSNVQKQIEEIEAEMARTQKNKVSIESLDSFLSHVTQSELFWVHDKGDQLPSRNT